MVINTQAAIALRCASCGELEVQAVSLFSFGRKNKLSVICSCGQEKALIVRERRGKVRLKVNCAICDQSHFIYLGELQLWSGETVHLACPDTKIEVGLIGSESEVREMVASIDQEDLAIPDQEQAEEYFENPDVMYDVLNHVHRLIEEGRLHCACKQAEVEVDVYPDRIELWCPSCGRWKVIRALKDEDLAVLDLNEIRLIDNRDHVGSDRPRGF